MQRSQGPDQPSRKYHLHAAWEVQAASILLFHDQLSRGRVSWRVKYWELKASTHSSLARVSDMLKLKGVALN